MSQEFKKLIASFEDAIKRKEAGKFDKKDVDGIYAAAHDFFKDDAQVPEDQLNQIKDKFVALAEGRIDKGSAQKKLHGTSRAEAIRSVLQSLVK